MAFVTDVAGLRSSAEADAYRGVQQALAARACSHSELIVSRRPSDYAANLEAAAGKHDDLVIAGSFLLTGALFDAARAKPGTHFLLIDPITTGQALPNAAVLTFRRDQATFLAGALAGMVTRSGTIAGVYGPGGIDDVTARLAFERGAEAVRPEIRVLGVYQPAGEGEPYNEPIWGADQARLFTSQGADVIFGGSGGTGQGALEGASSAGRSCIGTEVVDSRAPSCLIGSTRVDMTVGVTLAVGRLLDTWAPGKLVLGVGDGVVGLSTFGSQVPAEIRQRLQVIARRLGDGGNGAGV